MFKGNRGKEERKIKQQEPGCAAMQFGGQLVTGSHDRSLDLLKPWEYDRKMAPIDLGMALTIAEP